MLPGFDVALRFGATTRLTHEIQFILAQVAFDCSTRLVAGALRAQMTRGADLLGCAVINAVAILMQGFAFHLLSSRADIDVFLSVVAKPIFTKDTAFGAAFAGRCSQVRHMGRNAHVMASQEIVDGAVLAVGHYRQGRFISVVVVLFQQIF